MKIFSHQDITLESVYDVAVGGENIQLDASVLATVQKTRDSIEKILDNKQIIYGVTTGFGAFKNKFIETVELQDLQRNLILSHAVGVGPYLGDEYVRGIMLLIINYLSKGYSGVRPVVIDALVSMLNKGIVPLVPEQGSVGSSGDLAPSAHVVLALIGEGNVRYKNSIIPAKQALIKIGIKPVTLMAKEGLALINNTATMSSVGTIAFVKASRLVDSADIVSALSGEALRTTTKAYDPRIHKLKPHDGQMQVANRLTKFLEGSTMIDNSKIQDQYSLRCIPQIHGAVREALKYVKSVLTTEINSVTDNPLIFEKGDSVEILSGGNFHGESVAIAMDTLGIAMSEIANISDRRTASLLDPATNNGLPAFLAENGGVNSGMMILQYTTASLVSENKIYAHPASVDSIPTSANVEDLVSMGTIAARKANWIIRNVQNVLAIEAIVACQAIDFRLNDGFSLGVGTKKAYKSIRKVVPYFAKDEIYYEYINKVYKLIENL